MKSFKLDDQFFMKIYIFVQKKKRHTYVIMAKSKVTGMYILLLMFQQHCYYSTIQIFIVTNPLEAIGDSNNRTFHLSSIIILRRSRKKYDFFFQDCSMVSFNCKRKKIRNPPVFLFLAVMIHNLQWVTWQGFLSCLCQGSPLTVRNSQREKYLFLCFWCLFQKLKR